MGRAFSKLITLDEPDQNAAVWDLLAAIKDSMRWNKSLVEHPEVLGLLIEKSRQAMAQREQEKAERRARKAVTA